MKINSKFWIVSALILVSINSYTAETTTTTTVGQLGSSGDTIRFINYSGGVFGNACPYIYASDRYSINTVSYGCINERQLWDMLGWVKELLLLENPSANPDAVSIESGRQVCINNPSSCGITVSSLGGFTQEQINNAAYQARQACTEDPASCSIVVQQGFTQEDIDTSTSNAIQSCINNPSSCGIAVEENIPQTPSLSPNLDFHLNQLTYNSIQDGQQELWVDFRFIPDETKILFEAAAFGVIQGSDEDQDGFSIEQGDCNDTNSEIFPTAEEIQNDGVDQNCVSNIND